ncbi:DUF3986 family protein [Neobacillus cucumis]|uniref:DUF3986 family protein n=1 Tax=Neobacillus cucumis TaxID=1740721 RepID=UPI00203B172E|nr:DUF3986 family protein [Neobacillus cucumis]MCM3729836.1 DUF3986 family protein [Neobacillus cucumis]
MDILYDDKYHLHLGYYDDNCDYEAIAFKRQLEDVWDIFFDIIMITVAVIFLIRLTCSLAKEGITKIKLNFKFKILLRGGADEKN